MFNYFFEGIPVQEISDATTDWLRKIILNEGKKIGTINYIFSDDDYVLKVNQEYLDHDYFTDIITFDYARGQTISGDIFVSLPRISENAVFLDKDMDEELHRVLVHGILHICGYKDNTDTERNEMRNKEDFYLARRHY